MSTARSENGSRRTCSEQPGHGGTRRGTSADGTPCKGGRRDWGRGATQGAPRSSRQSAVAAVLAACHSHAAEPPHRAPPCPSIRQWGTHHVPTDPPYVDFYIGERLAMCAQRLGRRLALCRRVEPWRRGSRLRARASRAVLRSCSSLSAGCRVSPAAVGYAATTGSFAVLTSACCA
jgi:hypothetical protein